MRFPGASRRSCFAALPAATWKLSAFRPKRSTLTDYCRKVGRRDIPDWNYYLVYGMFRLAAIMQGILKRAAEGTAASQQAIDVGRRAPDVAAEAWVLAQRVDAGR